MSQWFIYDYQFLCFLFVIRELWNNFILKRPDEGPGTTSCSAWISSGVRWGYSGLYPGVSWNFLRMRLFSLSGQPAPLLGGRVSFEGKRFCFYLTCTFLFRFMPVVSRSATMQCCADLDSVLLHVSPVQDAFK